MITKRETGYLKWLWWKHTWTFQLAHKPLCQRFRRDVLQIGKLHVCRSCTAMYTAFGITLAAAFTNSSPEPAIPGPATLAVTVAVIALSAPPFYRHAPRVARDLLRASAGVVAALGVTLLVSSGWLYGAFTLALLFAAWVVYHRLERRDSSMADPCTGCHELTHGAVCSGYTHQAGCVRAYEKKATTWLETHRNGGCRMPTTPPRA